MRPFVILLFLAFVICFITARGILPPKYLSIKKWKNCVSTVQQETAEFICLPNTRPSQCPPASWKKLLKQNSVPACPQHRVH